MSGHALQWSVLYALIGALAGRLCTLHSMSNKIPQSGQADTTEITPKMIEAGEAILENYQGSYPSYLLVREIYIAMDALSRKRRLTGSC